MYTVQIYLVLVLLYFGALIFTACTSVNKIMVAVKLLFMSCTLPDIYVINCNLLLVFLVDLQRVSNTTVCISKQSLFMCETTVTGVLEWEDGNGSTIRFTSSANDPGANMTVGSVFYTLTDETPTSSLMSSAMVSSTNVDVLLLCTNGIETRNVRVNVAGKCNCAVSYYRYTLWINLCIVYVGQPGALNLSDPEPNNGPVLSSRVSWRGPDDIPNCCERYIAKIVSRTGKVEERVFSPTTTETNIFLNSSGTVTVFCQDAAGRNGTSSNSIQLPTGEQLYACNSIASI